MIKLQEIDIKADDVGSLYRFRLGFDCPKDIEGVKVRAAKFLDRESVLRLYVTLPSDFREIKLKSDGEFHDCKTPHAFLVVEVLGDGDVLRDLDAEHFVCETDDNLVFARFYK